MQSNDFIQTPIDYDRQFNFIDYGQPRGWEKRARKLRERRWRKIAGRLARQDHYAYNKPRHHVVDFR